MKYLFKSSRKEREERIRDFLLENKGKSPQETCDRLHGKSIPLFKDPQRIYFHEIYGEFKDISFEYFSPGERLYLQAGKRISTAIFPAVDVSRIFTNQNPVFSYGINFRYKLLEGKGTWFLEKEKTREVILSTLNQIKLFLDEIE